MMPAWYTAIRLGPDATRWLWFPSRAKWKPLSCCGATHEPLPDDSPPTAEEQTQESIDRLLTGNFGVIKDEVEYRVTQKRVRTFSELVQRMKAGTDWHNPSEPDWVRQAKLAGAEGVLLELQEEIAVWEASH